jgi:hypothetical protein
MAVVVGKMVVMCRQRRAAKEGPQSEGLECCEHIKNQYQSVVSVDLSSDCGCIEKQETIRKGVAI